MAEREFIPVKVGVLTVSDTRTEVDDASGDIVTKMLEQDGHRVVTRAIVKDNRDAIRGKLEMWIDDPEVEVIIATGGTGVTPRDVTPEALAPLVTKPIPGFGELFRMLSYQDIGAATIQSRAEAALCRKTYVFLLPGSPNACRFALEKILLPQLDHRTRPCNFVMLLPRIRGERED
jgi:molybdenum cofactor biosynthesis protein B